MWTVMSCKLRERSRMDSEKPKMILPIFAFNIFLTCASSVRRFPVGFTITGSAPKMNLKVFDYMTWFLINDMLKWTDAQCWGFPSGTPLQQMSLHGKNHHCNAWTGPGRWILLPRIPAVWSEIHNISRLIMELYHGVNISCIGFFSKNRRKYPNHIIYKNKGMFGMCNTPA